MARLGVNIETGAESYRFRRTIEKRKKRN